jgi:hypothetical protein
MPTMRFLQHLNAPLPRPYQLTADLLFTTDLRWAFGDDDPDVERIRKLVEDANQWGVVLPPNELSYRFARMLRRYAERWREAPDQHDLLRGLIQGVELAGSMPFEVDLWAPQNIFFEMGKAIVPTVQTQAQAGSPAAREWLADYLRLGELLGIALDGLKKKLRPSSKAHPSRRLRTAFGGSRECPSRHIACSCTRISPFRRLLRYCPTFATWASAIATHHRFFGPDAAAATATTSAITVASIQNWAAPKHLTNSPRP